MSKRTRNRRRPRLRRRRKPNPYIPEDIMYNILLMLPVKTLLRFKSVCKSWLSLISSRDFIETHLSKSTNDPHFTHYILLCITDSSTVVNSVYSLLNYETAVGLPVEFDYPTQVYTDASFYFTIGYSNGLVGLGIYGFDEKYDLFLWNPRTGSSRKLPKCDIEDSLIWNFDYCYDEFNNDFKFFVVAENYSMSVYSSNYDSWRRIEDFNFNLMNFGVYANGAVYWTATPALEDDLFTIVSLDMNTYTHREVLLPNYKYEEGAYYWTLLATLGKDLSILCAFETHADLWVMKKCGREEYWAKLFTIRKDCLPSYNEYLRPLYVSESGQIMLQIDSLILLYNYTANTYKPMFNCGCEKLLADVFVESLVSPNI